LASGRRGRKRRVVDFAGFRDPSGPPRPKPPHPPTPMGDSFLPNGLKSNQTEATRGLEALGRGNVPAKGKRGLLTLLGRTIGRGEGRELWRRDPCEWPPACFPLDAPGRNPLLERTILEPRAHRPPGLHRPPLHVGDTGN